MPRLLLARACLVVCACGSSGGCGPVADDGAYQVDARGASAIVDASWTLEGRAAPIAVVIAATRCGDTLVLADSGGTLHRLNLATGQTEAPVAQGMLAMSLAVDCAGGRLYALGPGRRALAPAAGRSIAVTELAWATGETRASIAVPAAFNPAPAGWIDAETLVLGGLWMPTPQPGYQHPPPPEFYKDKRLGLRVGLRDGEVAPLLEPYELGCRGGSRCAFVWIAPVMGRADVAWAAAEAAVARVGLYSRSGSLIRQVDISSPLFKVDGAVVRAVDAEQSMRWATTNSVIDRLDVFGGVLAVVHSMTRLPPGWTIGQSADFDYWLNLVDLDGRRLVADIQLPGPPIGRDEQHLYLVDYGAVGRAGNHDSVRILSVPVRTGRDGFVADRRP